MFQGRGQSKCVFRLELWHSTSREAPALLGEHGNQIHEYSPWGATRQLISLLPQLNDERWKDRWMGFGVHGLGLRQAGFTSRGLIAPASWTWPRRTWSAARKEGPCRQADIRANDGKSPEILSRALCHVGCFGPVHKGPTAPAWRWMWPKRPKRIPPMARLHPRC